VGGAVGRMKLNGIAAQVEEAIAALGVGTDAERVAAMLRKAYTEEHSLAEATRIFIHDLFGHYGLVIVDGDDAALKRLFTPIITEELVNQVAARAVSYANERIETRYPVQAHAREINLFYLRNGRSRIVQEGDHFQALDGGPRWTLEELLVRVEAHPEDLSPNVLLRPVYQEHILPNIAYIGGGGELAYWIQLRWLFQALRVPMPVVFLRTSAATISEKHLRQWNELGLSATDLFGYLLTLKGEVAKRKVS
ncbi:MAG TPA: bacillithiol biosynthesis BshC, partial [Flavobacteriales bacterium]|nr:bacillithiol biosynthesis BshC [Flavobacteriales bacterium]